MYLNILLCVIFFVCVSMLIREGMWNNALTLVNVITAGLLSANFWELLANWLDSFFPTFTYLMDFFSLWIVFCAAYAILRTATDFLSKVKVRFKLPVDFIGGIVFALWTGWVIVCFTTMTLHTAPLARSFLGGAFYSKPDDRVFFGSAAPDRQWLGFVQKMSRGSLATSPPDHITGEEGANVFDPQGEFIFRYGQRRANFEKIKGVRSSP